MGMDAAAHSGALLGAVQHVLRGFSGSSREQFVQRALELLGTAADVDRSYVFENCYLPDGTLAASQRFEWCAPGIPSTLHDPDLQEVPYVAAGMGRWLARFTECAPIAGSVEDFPESERPLLRAQGILSLAAVPIHVDGELWGFVGFDALRRETHWTPDMLSALLAAASAIGHQESRVRAERELIESRRRFERAVKGAHGGIYDRDLQEDAVWCSPGFAEMLGLAPEDLCGSPENWRGRIHPEDAPRVARALQAHLQDRAPYEMTYRLRHEDGSWRWFHDQGSAEFDEADHALRMSGTIIDVTERRRLEDMLHQSQRLEAVGRLAGGVAHDFNNMLSVILGYSETLKRKLGDDVGCLRHVEEITRAAQRSAKITGQLLAFARRQVVEPKQVDTRDLLTGMQGVVESLLGERCKLQLILPSSAGTICVDVSQFEQVLANLATNARDAMPNGGTLTIECETLLLDEEYARLHANVEPGAYVCISISDTGDGMSSQTLQNIFEPFFTTKPAGRGTGLGLASTKGFVERAGGFLRVYSELGQGTTFKIYVPSVQGAPEISAKVIPREQIPRGHETVLIVEDQPELGNMMVESLSEAGYRTHYARDVASAMDIFQTLGSVDVLVTDVVLPDGSGADVAERAERAHPQCKVVFTSGYTENVVADRGVMKPDISFLPKPLTPSQLARKVRAVLDDK